MSHPKSDHEDRPETPDLPGADRPEPAGATTRKTEPSDALTDADLDQVSGGLNPQPLPPRWRKG